MSAAAVYTGFFLALVAITFVVPFLPPAQLIFEILNIPLPIESFLGVSVATLLNCLINGFIWGIFAAVVYSLSKNHYKRRQFRPLPTPEPMHVTNPEPKPLDWRADRYPPAITISKKRDKKEQEIETIEGIGALRGQMMRNRGIITANDLLRAGATRPKRQRLANEFGVSYATMSKWVHRADLLRIRGIGSQYSELLQTAGVNTVTYLSKRDPHSLWLQMKAINREKKLVRKTPPLKKIENWVHKAKNLEPIIQ